MQWVLNAERRSDMGSMCHTYNPTYKHVKYDTLSPLLLHVHILSVSLRCAEDLGMVEQLLQTISRELSVVDVMGVFRGTHDTTRLVLSSYLHVSKPSHSPHSSHLPLTSSHTAPLTYHTFHSHPYLTTLRLH